ncbi:MAG: PaaI family thioesterase [Desulfuromonadales bacterium]|nr:PaaI family thioesterase [Desulfuromonadales bacterium]
MTFITPNPDFGVRLHERFSSTGTMGTLGARLVRVGPGEVELELPYHHGVSQNNGFFHGGIIGTMLDTACGYAALTIMPADDEVLTVEYKINFLSPAAGELLVARGRVLRAGKTLTICEADGIMAVDGKEKCVARMTATMIATKLTTLGQGETDVIV